MNSSHRAAHGATQARGVYHRARRKKAQHATTAGARATQEYEVVRLLWHSVLLRLALQSLGYLRHSLSAYSIFQRDLALLHTVLNIGKHVTHSRNIFKAETAITCASRTTKYFAGIE